MAPFGRILQLKDWDTSAKKPQIAAQMELRELFSKHH